VAGLSGYEEFPQTQSQNRNNHCGERKEQPRLYHKEVENISDQSHRKSFARLAIIELAHAGESEA